MTNVAPHQALIARIHSREFRDECRRWLPFVKKLIHAAGLTPAEAQAEAILGDTVVRCLSGDLEWKDGVDFPTFFLCALRDRVRCEARRTWRRRKVMWSGVDAYEVAAASRREAEVMDAVPELARARAALSAHPLTRAMLEAIEDGASKAAEVQERLGWSAERTRAVRVLANRRLEAAGLRRGKYREAG